MKQIAKHIALSAMPVFQSELFDEQAVSQFLLLTSNANTQTSSLLLYDLSNPTTRSCGVSMPTDLGDSGALMTWL